MIDRSQACIESIWIKNHKIQLIDYHQSRYEKTIKELYEKLPNQKLIKHIDRYALPSDDVKCRVIYDGENIEVEYEVYNRRSFKSLKVVDSKSIQYDYKKLVRSKLDDLWSQREGHNEIIIVKDDLVTDAYYFNLVFHDGANFYTPLKCLLKGVRRESYISKSKVKVQNITVGDLKNFNSVFLINALNPLGEIEVSIENVIF